MPVNASQTNNGLIVAALLALTTDWNLAETRTGRRGEFKTTGANMFRIRELNDAEADQVKLACASFGMDVEDEELAEFFGGDFEYQISYACNKFPTKSGGRQPALTQNEIRTLERARQIMATKEQAATQVLTKKAA